MSHMQEKSLSSFVASCRWREEKMKVSTRRRVFAANSRCVSCGATKDLQIDHIYPKSKGGSDIEGNLQVLCVECNYKKSNKHLSYVIRVNREEM